MSGKAVVTIDEVKSDLDFLATSIAEYVACKSECWIEDERAARGLERFGVTLEAYIDQRIQAALKEKE
jgi:hypothetical protein